MQSEDMFLAPDLREFREAFIVQRWRLGLTQIATRFLAVALEGKRRV